MCRDWGQYGDEGKRNFKFLVPSVDQFTFQRTTCESCDFENFSDEIIWIIKLPWESCNLQLAPAKTKNPNYFPITKMHREIINIHRNNKQIDHKTP